MVAPLPIGHPWMDESRAPLYLYAFPPSISDEALIEFCAARERWARSARYPVAWVADLENVRSASAKQRKIFADHLERYEPHDVKWTRGVAIVAPNAVVRGLVTAVFWLKAPSFSYRVFTTRPEAIRWAKEQLVTA